MIVIDKGLKVASILTLALKEYSIKEVEFIGSYLIDLKGFALDVEYIRPLGYDMDYIDNLSSDLSEFTNVGQPVFLLSDYAFELLEKKGYDISIFNVGTILELLDVTTRFNEVDINNDIEPILRAIVLKALNKLSIDKLNAFYLNYATWNKCGIDIDYIFEYKGAFYVLDANTKDCFIRYDKKGLNVFNSDFIELCSINDLIGCIDILNDL